MAETDSTIRQSATGRYEIPKGELLEDRIRNELTGGLAEQVKLLHHVAQEVQKRHLESVFHGELSSHWISLDGDKVTIYGPKSSDESLRPIDIRGFGFAAYEVLAGEMLTEEGIPDDEPDLEALHKAGLPPRLIQVVENCIALDKQIEFPKVIRELETVLRSMIRPTGKAFPRWIGFAAAAVALLILAIFMLMGGAHVTH